MTGGRNVLAHAGRLLSLLLLAALGSAVLMRYAPGYLADSRELDAAHAQTARAELQRLEQQEGSVPQLLRHQGEAWLHGDLGQSRHYDVPVAALIRERLAASARLLVLGVGLGWLLAAVGAIPLSLYTGTRGSLVVALLVSLLLAIPVGVLATLSLLANMGGPVLILALLTAVRDFKLLHGLLVAAWCGPEILFARAQGYSPAQCLRVHLLASLRPELLNLLGMSLLVALSALVPVEVVLDVPGLGQLAWASAINRDLPVLVAMTLLMALGVGGVGLLLSAPTGREATVCE